LCYFVEYITPFGVKSTFYNRLVLNFYNDMYKEKLAENLKTLIGNRSVGGVAKEIGIPQQTLFRYLHCQREIGLENLIKIADYFDEDLDCLTGRKQ